jgi:hypothetical protein
VFQSKQGSVDEMRNLLVDKNMGSSADGQAMAGIASLLTMFASSPGLNDEDFFIASVLLTVKF